MSELIYVDTNIYIDHFDGRVDKLRPLGEFAFQILKRAVECEFNIAVSALVLKELYHNLYETETKELLSSFDAKGKIVRIEITEEDVQEARHICKERKTHFNDTLHAVLAHKIRAVFIVTRNVKDFFELRDLICAILPENL